MPAYRKVGDLAPAASVGSQTHVPVEVPAEADTLMIEFEVEAVGATPTVTYNVQGSMDDADVPVASSDWFEMFGLPSAGAAEVDISGTVTAVGVSDFTLDLRSRAVKKLRLVTSANTNVTYNSEVHSGTDN